MGDYADLLSRLEQPSGGDPQQSSSGIHGIIRGAAERYKIDPRAMLALAHEESSLNPNARNKESTAGGLFQFLDGTWKQYGRGDKFDPEANADAAARMLRENLDRFGGNYDLALAAHHVGPGAARKALSDSSVGDVNVSTQNWLKKIKSRMGGDMPELSGAQAQGEVPIEPRTDYSSLLDKYKNTPNSTLSQQTKADAVKESIAKGRSWGEAATDTGAAVLKGAGNFAESMAGLYGLATGDVDPGIVQNGGKALADFAESLKSDFIKNKERLSQQDIDAAEGHFNKFGTAAWSNLSDPALMVNFFAEQAINFVPGMAAGRLAKGIIAGLGGASAAAIEAAPLAQKAMLMKRLETAGQIGTGVSVATGAVLQGADAGNSAYQQVMARPQTEWDANAEYQRLVPTLGMDGAKKQIALNEARAAFAKSAVLSAGLNSFAPAHSIDKILVNGLKNKALTTAGREVVEKAAGQSLSRAAGTGAVKGFLGESASEAIDEGYGQYVANQAEAAVNPNKDVLDEVAQNAGLGAAFGPIGAVTGGIDGAGRRKSAQEVLALAQQTATEQAAAKPNSPLSRAAVAAAPGVAAADQAAQAQAQAADPLAEQVAAIGDRLNDRAIYDAIRNHENLGPQALNDILGSYRVASNFNLDIKQRQAAVERLNQFFKLFDNQPNFTMGSNGQGEQGGALVPSQRGGQPPSGPNVPTYDVGAPALGYRRQGDTLTDERAARQAQAEYEAAYADLVKAEQLGASDAELMQKQMAMRQAEARLQEIAQAIDGNRQLDSAAKRDALLGDILAALPPGQNPNRAFDRALRNAGFTDTQFSEAERAKIAQWQQLSDGFMQQEQEPSKPNQLDAAAMGIKENKEAAAGTPGAKLREVDAMLQAGMVRRGDKMFDPRTGKSVKLSPAQIARAKHVEQQKERGRVMPAYERAIAQRTQQLEQLLANPNHDEREAVRLARSLSGLKQMVAKLQGGASLDDAITSVFGKVDAQAANALKNPAVRAGAETPPTVLPDRRRITPMDDDRLAKWGEELTSMAGDAGWSEIGGRLIRNDDGSMARTRWVPRAEWFMAGMINDPKASEDAVRKALAGEPMTLKEKNHVSAMMDFLDAVHDLSDAGKQALVDGMRAISHDSDFGLPNFADTEGVLIDLESTEWSSVPPDYFDTIEESNNEQGTVAANEAGAAEGSQAATGRAGEGGGNTAQGALPGEGERQELSLTGQTNQEAAAEFRKQQQADAAKTDKEPPAKNVVADQGDLFNTQGALFNSNRDTKRHGSTVEFVRQGDFWNYYGGRADEIARAIGVTQMTRNGKPMLGIPDYALALTKDDLKRAGIDAVFVENKADAPGAQTATAPEKSEASPFDEKARDAEREKLKEQLLADVRAGKVALVDGQQNLAEFDKQTKAMREGAAPGELTYEQFKSEMADLLKKSFEYKPNQAGFGIYSEKMAKLSDKYPEYQKRLDQESDSAQSAVNPENEQKPVADSQTANQPEEEPNFAAAKALVQEAKETHGDKRKEAVVRKKARELAAKTPINHEKTVLALDMISTRLGMGDNGTKPLEFADAEKQEAKPLPNATAPEHVATGASDEGKAQDTSHLVALYTRLSNERNRLADAKTDNEREQRAVWVRQIEKEIAAEREFLGMPPEDVAADALTDDELLAELGNGDNDEQLGDVTDYERYVLISADDISKLRKIDVERVLEQGAVKAFRQSFANWIKAKRPDLAGEVDDVMADLSQQKNDTTPQAAPDKAPDVTPKTGLDKAADAIDAKIDDVAARLAAKLKASRGTLNAGVDPELLLLGAELGSLYIAKGVVKFAQYSRAIIAKLKELGIDAAEVKPMLKEFYLASQATVDDDTFDQMDSPRDVRRFDLDTLEAADDLRASIEAAEQATNHDATPGQKEAGNYAKGKFAWNGLTISVETAKGEDRTDKETNGDKWRVTMPATYGYIKGTTGADGDQVDVFMGPNPDSGKVYVINQTQVGSEKFDEHKVMLGYQSERAARADYLASFSDGFGRQVYGSLEGPFSVSEFRSMLDEGEFEQKAEIDTGRRLDERIPLSEITVTVEAVEAETGRTVEMDENAADAIKDIDDRMKLARSLLECLAS